MLPVFAHQRAEAFAVCSGRLSAIGTRQRADQHPDALETLEMMGTFDLLLEATVDDAFAQGVPKREPGRWKTRGWTEIAALLKDVVYSSDAGVATRAQRAIERRLQDCRDLVLPG